MQYLGKADLAKIFRAGFETNRTHHLVMLLQFFTGARISQVLNVRGEDIFQREGKWVVLVRAAKRGNEVTRDLHFDVNDPAFDMTPLIELAKTKRQSLLFGGLDRHYFNKCLRKYADKVGIHSSFAHSHVFRHSVAMAIFDATGRIGAVSQFLAHRSPSSAFCYLAENDNSLAQDAVNAVQLT